MLQVLSLKKRSRQTIRVAFLVLVFLLTLVSKPYAMGLGDFLQGSAAFLTQIAVHESGHQYMAKMGDGKDVKMEFFKKKDDNFFIGLASAKGINSESILPFRAAGVVASSHLFNLSLSAYRAAPSSYNQSLLFFSGTDFLWYSVWSFYVQKSDDPSYDPVGIAQETGFSQDAIFGAALLQSAINYYRASSENDTLLPYMTVDKRGMGFGVTVSF